MRVHIVGSLHARGAQTTFYHFVDFGTACVACIEYTNTEKRTMVEITIS